MQCGWRRQGSTFRCVGPPSPRDGLVLVPRCCFTLRCRSCCPARANIHACWCCCAHRRDPCIEGNVHGFGLSHVGCLPSWTSHVPHRDSYRGPCHWTCHCLYLGTPRTVVSVLSYAKGASPTRCLCQRCWNGDLNNYQKEQTLRPGPSSKTA